MAIIGIKRGVKSEIIFPTYPSISSVVEAFQVIKVPNIEFKNRWLFQKALYQLPFQKLLKISRLFYPLLFLLTSQFSQFFWHLFEVVFRKNLS